MHRWPFMQHSGQTLGKEVSFSGISEYGQVSEVYMVQILTPALTSQGSGKRVKVFFFFFFLNIICFGTWWLCDMPTCGGQRTTPRVSSLLGFRDWTQAIGLISKCLHPSIISPDPLVHHFEKHPKLNST